MGTSHQQPFSQKHFGALGSRLVSRGVVERAFDGFTGMMVQRGEFGDGK